MLASNLFIPMTGTLCISRQIKPVPHTAVVFSKLQHFFKCYHILVSSKISRPNKDLRFMWSSQVKSIVSACSAVNNHNDFHKVPILKVDLINLNLKAYYSEKRFTFENPGFASYLKTLEEEFTSLQSSLNDNQDIKKTGNTDASHNRLAFLKPVIGSVEVLKQKYSELQDLSDLHESEDDPEMKSLALKDIAKLKTEISEIEEEIVFLLVGEEVADDSDIMLEVSAGVGGQEAMLFASELFGMYLGYARYKNWTVTGLRQEEDAHGGSRKAMVQIKGNDVYKHLKHEIGVHRVQRVPKTEKSGRMHTSTVTISVLPEPKEIDIDIDPKDLKIETMRASGPGGQSVNTTDSAVRITHLPSGTVSECREERSQIQNKAKALEKLKSRMYQEKVTKMENERRANLKMQIGSKGRSEKVRTYNYRDDRISDHRVNAKCSNVLGFLSGEDSLDELIESLEISRKHDMLDSMLEQHLSKK